MPVSSASGRVHRRFSGTLFPAASCGLWERNLNRLSRLFSPKSIALYGGGWAENVLRQLIKSGYSDDIWPVHPHKSEMQGFRCLKDTASLPGVPDAAFIGVNRNRTIPIVKELADMGAGGAVCFASGFAEAGVKTLQDELIQAAGGMPILGPNCYGFLNYLDNVPMWPDQHGGRFAESGAVIIAQSSNIAINLTMQKRGLDIAQLVTIGNQAVINLADIGMHMLSDPRINAIGLYLEGFGDIRALEVFAAEAHARQIPVVILKTGKTDEARAAALTHTSSLSGSEKAASAFIRRLGFYEVETLAEFLECLKFMQHGGPLAGRAVASVSCSGGEASLMSDLSRHAGLNYRDFSSPAKTKLGDLLGDKVEIANPLDYHTYIWGDTPRMTDVFAAVMDDGFDLNLFVLDVPRADICDPSGHDCAVDAIIAAKARTGARVAVIASLPENLEEDVISRFLQGGVLPLLGMETALRVVDIASQDPGYCSELALMGNSQSRQPTALSEHASKQKLATFGVAIPKGILINSPQLPGGLNYPLAVKVSGAAHKTESGGVILNIQNQAELFGAVTQLLENSDHVLVEEMVSGPFTELIVGASIDDTGLWTLTIGAGGVLAEVLQDTAAMTLPARAEEIEAAIHNLKISKLLNGYRGAPPANMEDLVTAILSAANFVEAHKDSLVELDINPLAAGPETTTALDALIIERK